MDKNIHSTTLESVLLNLEKHGFKQDRSHRYPMIKVTDLKSAKVRILTNIVEYVNFIASELVIDGFCKKHWLNDIKQQLFLFDAPDVLSLKDRLDAVTANSDGWETNDIRDFVEGKNESKDKK